MRCAAERQLRASTCRWTAVGPEVFARTWCPLLQETAGRSHRPPVLWESANPIAGSTSRTWPPSSSGCGRRLAMGPGARDRGPECLTLDALARAVMAQRGWTGVPRRVPRGALRVLAQTAGRARPALGRQVRASLAMDGMPTVDCSALRAELPDLPATPVSSVLRRRGASSAI